MPSPQSWVMVCRDRAARPTGRVKYCYAVYSVVKVLCRDSLQIQDNTEFTSLSMQNAKVEKIVTFA